MTNTFSESLFSSGRQVQSSALRRFVDKTVAAYVRYASTCYERYQARLQLQEMSDEMLRDIGITRYDIDGKVNGRF